MLTRQAAAILGVSSATVRQYTKRYAPFLSPTAQPAPGRDRDITDTDLHIMAYIVAQTRAGLTHEEITARVAAGEWREHPAPTVPSAEGEREPEPSPLALVATQLQASLAREEELHRQIAELSRQIGRLEGELAALRPPPPPPPSGLRGLLRRLWGA